MPERLKRKRPSAVWVEVSDEEHAPRLRGALRGLDARVVLADPNRSTELPSSGTVRTTRTTRATIHGPSGADYDMKYHPMDDVLRPGRKRRPRSEELPELPAGETSDESEPSPAESSNSDASDTESSSSTSSAEGASRKKHPEATRCSSRKKADFNYSRKHHPADAMIPGFERKARRQKVSTVAEVIDSDEEHDDDSEDEGPMLPPRSGQAQINSSVHGGYAGLHTYLQTAHPKAVILQSNGNMSDENEPEIEDSEGEDEPSEFNYQLGTGQRAGGLVSAPSTQSKQGRSTTLLATPANTAV